nr:hypothetical protein [Lactiplantibacillus plantarum]
MPSLVGSAKGTGSFGNAGDVFYRLKNWRDRGGQVLAGEQFRDGR